MTYSTVTRAKVLRLPVSLMLLLLLSSVVTAAAAGTTSSATSTSSCAAAHCINGINDGISWLSKCASDGHGELMQLYVSTLDGKLTALSSMGKRLWRYKFSQPLYSSTLSYSEPSSQFPNLIPGLDKKLYQWDGIHLTPLPLSMEDLVREDFSYSGSSNIRAGGKTKEDIALSVVNGKPLYRCTQFSCLKYDNQSQIGLMDRLLVSAHRTTVREADSLTGDELWNFTVSHLRLSLLEGEVSSEEDISCQLNGDDGVSSDWIVKIDSTKGILFVSNSFTEISWDIMFTSPIMDVWLHHGGKLEKLSLTPFEFSEEKEKPALLLGIWHNQYYIQPTIGSEQLKQQQSWKPHVIGQIAAHHYGDKSTCDIPSSNHPGYSPVLPTDTSDNGLVTLYAQHQNWLNELSTSGPNGLALYFNLIESEVSYASCYKDLENTSADQTTQKTNSYENNIEPTNRPGYISKAYEYGKTIVQYTVFAVLVLAVNKLRRYHTQQWNAARNNNTLEGEQNDDSSDQVFRLPDRLDADSLLPPGFGTTNRRSSSSSTIKPSPTYDLLPILEEENSPIPSGPQRLDSSSRFDTEYETVGLLGKGGFGVVYHVRNRTDNIEYALKRIKLPEKKSAREKVMREVHALAQLDHPNIVRYFNSWVQQAPPGWDRREEWVALSRVSSLVKMDELSSSKMSSQLSSSLSRPLTSASSSNSSIPVLSSSNGSIPISSVPIFNDSLTSELPPIHPISRNDSHSSFTIEFRNEDSQSRLSGCDDCRSGSPICISAYSKGAGSSLVDYQLSAASDCREDAATDTCTSNDDSEDEAAHKENEDVKINLSSVAGTAEGGELRQHSLTTPSFVFIQMQLCQKESLKDWLKKNVHNRPRIEVWRMFEQILNAVVYVHTKGLMHRDLKPSNIFFSLDGGIKVGDFGLVTGHITPDTHNSSFNVLKHLGQETDKKHTGNIGTHFYVSPEQMMGHKYDQKVDIFSLGVILFELNHPFLTEMERSKVLEGLRKSRFPPGFKKHLQQEAVFVEWLMSPVTKRPSSYEVAKSSRLEDLKEMIRHSDFSYIPKL